MLDKLTHADFEPLLQQSFTVHVSLPDGQTRQIELMLDEVAVLGGAGMGRVPFSLLFRGPLGLFLPQQIYSIDHPALGALDIFLVPMQPNAAGSWFQAIFT